MRVTFFAAVFGIVIGCATPTYVLAQDAKPTQAACVAEPVVDQEEREYPPLTSSSFRGVIAAIEVEPEGTPRCVRRLVITSGTEAPSQVSTTGLSSICVTETTRSLYRFIDTVEPASMCDLRTGAFVAVQTDPQIGTTPRQTTARLIEIIVTEPRRLFLTEVGSYPLPQSFEATNVSLIGHDSILVISSIQGRVVLIVPDSVIEFGTGSASRPLAARVDADGTVLQVFDAADNSVVGFYESGAVAGRRRSGLDAVARMASATKNGWFIVAEDTLRGDRLSIHSLDQDLELHRVFTLEADSAAAWGDVLVSAVDSAVFISSARVPVRGVLVEATGQVSLTLKGPTSESLEREGEGLPFEPEWIGFPIVSLGDSRALQTILDLRSDRRWLVVYGEDGQARTTTSIKGPLTFLASWPETRKIVGYRSVNIPELVVYKWSWK